MDEIGRPSEGTVTVNGVPTEIPSKSGAQFVVYDRNERLASGPTADTSTSWRCGRTLTPAPRSGRS